MQHQEFWLGKTRGTRLDSTGVYAPLIVQYCTNSYSECLPLVTAITLTNIMVFGLGVGLCLSNSHTIFLFIPHFRSLNITIGFYIFFPSDSSSIFLNKYLTIPLLRSLPTLYPIPLTQSAVNTQFPHSFPFTPFIQSPQHNLMSTHKSPTPFPSLSLSNHTNTICCQPQSP